MPDVAAITVRPPWSHAIAHGDKRIENRVWGPGWPIPRLLIHAGRKIENDAARMFREAGLAMPANPTTSAIVAVATLERVCSASVNSPQVICDCGMWAAASQYHWKLDGVRALPEPVPCAGRLGLWQPTAEIIAAVFEQVR
jgi:hypothetical protein